MSNFGNFESSLLDKDPRVLVYDAGTSDWFGDFNLRNRDVESFATSRHAPYPDRILIEARRCFSKATPFYAFFPADTVLSSEFRKKLADELAHWFLGDDFD